ncbi:MAG: hypothetical protein ACYS99_09540, partial [Planctomycetota bacterium]
EVRVAHAASRGAVNGSRSALTHLADGRALLVELTEQDAPAPEVRPGWRRVDPAGSPRLDRSDPLVDHALEIARVRLDLHQRSEATEVLEASLADGPRGSWTGRACIRPGLHEVALVRRPVGHAPEEVLAALDLLGVESADTCGFLTVREGVLVACVEPGSVGSVDRAIGALGRAASSGAAPTVRIPGPRPGAPAPNRAGGAVSLTDADSISYVEDFDIETDGTSWIADPVISVLEDGALVEARPVKGQPGVYDVRIAHAWLERPIPVFTTGIGSDRPVTIQLPRLDVYETSRRMRLGEGETREIETTVSRGEESDTRRFLIGSGPQ